MKASERTKVVEFLKRHVIGKAVVAPPVTTQVDQGRITTAHEEDAVFSNLTESARGFSFDLTTLARGTRYVPDKSGHLLAEGTLNTVRVVRYDITERLSTGKLVGFSRFTSSTNSEPDPLAGALFLVQMSLARERLTVLESMVGYADRISADGSAMPMAWDGKYTYAVKDGALAVHYEQETFDVDPATLRRTPTGEKHPPQVSREIQFPAELVRS